MLGLSKRTVPIATRTIPHPKLGPKPPCALVINATFIRKLAEQLKVSIDYEDEIYDETGEELDIEDFIESFADDFQDRDFWYDEIEKKENNYLVYLLCDFSSSMSQGDMNKLQEVTIVLAEALEKALGK